MRVSDLDARLAQLRMGVPRVWRSVAQGVAVLLTAFAIAIGLLTLVDHQDWNTVHILWADSAGIMAVAVYLFRRSS